MGHKGQWVPGWEPWRRVDHCGWLLRQATKREFGWASLFSGSLREKGKVRWGKKTERGEREEGTHRENRSYLFGRKKTERESAHRLEEAGYLRKGKGWERAGLVS